MKTTSENSPLQDVRNNLSAVSVGVPQSAHSVATTCPHCQQAHTVVLAESADDAALITSAMSRLLTIATETMTDAPRVSPGRRPRLASILEEVKEMRGTTHKRAVVHSNERASKGAVANVPPYMLRPRYRYYAVDRRRHPQLSDSRQRVYAAIEKAGNTGITAKEIQKVAKATHGTVQQVLNYLRAQELVRFDREIPAEVR
jgi:uncharacterized Zn finger protein (UPF0148 family)